MAFDEAALRAFVTAHNQQATFEGRIKDLEGICRRDLLPKRRGNRPVIALDAQPAESRPWYAKEILDAIIVVRHWLKEGDADLAASEALVVGMLAARAGAHHHWPAVQRWNERLAVLRQASPAGAQTTRQNADDDAAVLLDEVAAVQVTHPEWSVRAIAQHLIGRPGQDAGEVEIDQSDQEHQKRINKKARAIRRAAQRKFAHTEESRT